MTPDEIRAAIDALALDRATTLDALPLLPAERDRRRAELWERERRLWEQLDVGPFDRAVTYARLFAEERAAEATKILAWTGRAGS